MVRKTLIFSIPCICFISSLAFAYNQFTQPGKAEHQHNIIGTVLLFNPTDLKVQKVAGASAQAVYNFKVTEKTQFTGTIEAGKTVSVNYLRKRLNKHTSRLIALSVAVLGH